MERRDFTVDTTEIQRIISDYYELTNWLTQKK